MVVSSESDVEGSHLLRRTVKTLVELANALTDDYDVGDFLQLLVDRCTELLSADVAGVMVEGSAGEGLQLAAASSHEMLAVKAIELDSRRGPGVEAYRRCETVTVADLRDYVDQWPETAERLVGLGMRSGIGLPMRFRGDCIGALNLYRREVGTFRDDDMELGQALADVATLGIFQQRRVDEAEMRAAQLQHALDSRVLIEQAKGMLANRYGVSPAEAFTALRAHARRKGRSLRAVCQAVIDSELDIPVGG